MFFHDHDLASSCTNISSHRNLKVRQVAIGHEAADFLMKEGRDEGAGIPFFLLLHEHDSTETARNSIDGNLPRKAQ